MSSFKLLSRSTKLKKPTSSQSTSTPSSGQTANPQLFGRSNDSIFQTDGTTTEFSVSKKRKRDPQSASDGLPAELDFFGGNVLSHSAAEAAATPGNTVRADREGAGQDLDPVGLEDVVLNEDECKRRLRAHKLKITVLEEHGGTTADGMGTSKKSKRRRKDQETDHESSRKGKKHKPELFPQPLENFRALSTRYNVGKKLAQNVEDQGYELPTEVQMASLPLLLEQEEIDLLTVAPTGSGKTLSFLIPIVHRLEQSRQERRKSISNGSLSQFFGPQAIIIAPTKELASQITNEGRKLTSKMGIKITMMRKGMALFSDSVETRGDAPSEEDSQHSGDSGSEGAYKSKQKRIKAEQLVKADILVSTPLALMNAIKRDEKVRPLESVLYFVLDEADVLLDPLFREQTLNLWKACTSPELRISLWSATMGSNIEELAKSVIASRWAAFTLGVQAKHPRKQLVRFVVGLKDSAIPNISHQLTFAATEQGKLLALRQLLHPTTPSSAAKNSKEELPRLVPPFLVFTQTIPRAVALYSELRYDIPPEAGGSSRIAVLHADLSDKVRDDVMARFRKGEVWILITTDLLARGVDFRGVNGVVNYDFPTSAAAYVHRVGRTGRAGRAGGVAVTLYTKEDVPFVKNVANVIAASERMRGNTGESNGKGVQQWLLDALPTPTKRDKQMLKKKGIEARRPNAGKEGLKARISTRSGFERKMENNRKGAVRRNAKMDRVVGGGGDTREESGSEFEGFSD